MARNVLSQKERFALTNLVKDQYVNAAVTDGAFAKWASDSLGFEVNASHVLAARNVLDISSTKFAPVVPEKMVERVALLEKRLAALEERVNAYMKD